MEQMLQVRMVSSTGKEPLGQDKISCYPAGVLDHLDVLWAEFV